MNEPTSPPPIPLPSESLRIGQDPTDRQAVDGLISAIEAILRHPRRIVYQLHCSGPGASSLMVGLFIIVMVCGLAYGAVVGSFSGGVQLWAAPVKIALGTVFAAAICLPSLYIFSSLGGSEAKLSQVLGLLLGQLALTYLLLIGLAPVAWIFSECMESVAGMGTLHLLFWFVSIAFGIRFLRNGFRLLGIHSTSGINLWTILFLLVAMQMTTVLRPLVGTSPTWLNHEKRFFLVHWTECIDGHKPATHRN